jgi:hypothetical protein
MSNVAGIFHNMSSGLRPRICNCGSRTAGEVLFFARAKKSTQKKARPDGATTPCASRPNRHAPQLAGRWETRLGLEHEARDYPDSGCDARARHTGWKSTPQPGIEVGCSPPVSRTEHRSEAGSFQASPCSSRAAYFAADELASARLREEHREPRVLCAVSDPGVFSFGDFSLHEQRKVTQGAGAEPPAISFSSCAQRTQKKG